MLVTAIMDVSVRQLFGGRFAQADNFHIEMQLIAGERMIEVQGHIFTFNRIDACIA